jgi:AcrR family transcriptional regulator
VIGSWPNAKKKEGDELPVINAVSAAKTTHPALNLARLIRACGLPPSTFFRYLRRRDLGEPLWSPRGRPPVNIPDLDLVKELLKSQWDGQRHRLRGAGKIRRQYPDISAAALARLIAEVKAELCRNRTNTMLMVHYCEPHLIWSMDIFEYHWRDIDFHILQVEDLGSRFKFEPAVKIGAFTGAEVAAHLQMLCRQQEPPLFLKRDNGTNLNAATVENILRMFALIPLNSPPAYPRYNGVMERSQEEIQRYLRRTFTDHDVRDVFASGVYSAIDRANQFRRPILGGKAAWEVFAGYFKHYGKRERESIYDEIMNAAQAMIAAAGATIKNPAAFAAAAWRQAVRQWLEDHHLIVLYRRGQPLRETTPCQA